MNKTNIVIKQRDYYSSHIDEFVEKYLNIKLTEWQKILINILNKQITHRRGRIQNKEYIRNVWIFSKCLLEFDTHILITLYNSNIINGLRNSYPNCPKRAGCTGGCPICRDIVLCNNYCKELI